MKKVLFSVGIISLAMMSVSVANGIISKKMQFVGEKQNVPVAKVAQKALQTSTSPSLKIGGNAFGSMSNFEDGSVFYAESLSSGKVLCMPGGMSRPGYQVGIDVKDQNRLDQCLQFRPVRAAIPGTDDYKTYYTISMMSGSDFKLSYWGGDYLNLDHGDFVQQYDLFDIVNVFGTFYTISPRNSGGRKLVPYQDYSVSLSNSNGWDTWWSFKKSDFLAPATKTLTTVETNQRVDYRIKVNQTANYSITTFYNEASFDTKLYLYNEYGDLLTQNDDYGGTRFSRINYHLEEGYTYKLQVGGWSTSHGNCFVSINPVGGFYVNYYMGDYGEGFGDCDDIDTFAAGFNLNSSMPVYDIYYDEIINQDRDSYIGYDIEGKQRPNHEYYLLSAHGGTYGGVSTSPDDDVSPTDITDMSDNEFSMWSVCYGGMEGNFAHSSARKGSQYSLGFENPMYVDSAAKIEEYVFKRILNYNEPIETSVKKAFAKLVKEDCSCRDDDGSFFPILYCGDGRKINIRNEIADTILDSYPNGTLSCNTVLSSGYYEKLDYSTKYDLYVMKSNDGIWYGPTHFFGRKSSNTIVGTNLTSFSLATAIANVNLESSEQVIKRNGLQYQLDYLWRTFASYRGLSDENLIDVKYYLRSFDSYELNGVYTYRATINGIDTVRKVTCIFDPSKSLATYTDNSCYLDIRYDAFDYVNFDYLGRTAFLNLANW